MASRMNPALKVTDRVVVTLTISEDITGLSTVALTDHLMDILMGQLISIATGLVIITIIA